MKTIKLIPLLFLVLIFMGCGNPDADLWNEKAKIYSKYQNDGLKKLGCAQFTIHTTSDHRFTYREITLVLDEKFGEPGYTIQFTNGMMYSLPKSETEK